MSKSVNKCKLSLVQKCMHDCSIRVTVYYEYMYISAKSYKNQCNFLYFTQEEVTETHKIESENFLSKIQQFLKHIYRFFLH